MQLEDKLTMLGYKLHHEVNLRHYPKEALFVKAYDRTEDVMISIYLEDGVFDEDFCQVELNDKYGKYGFSDQSAIDVLYTKLTEALKILQKDLEILKNVE